VVALGADHGVCPRPWRRKESADQRPTQAQRDTGARDQYTSTCLLFVSVFSSV
jgi:hypothetical protein